MSFLLVHMVYILLLIKFPIFGKQKLLKKKKTIHIIFVTFVIVTSALGPFVPVAMSNYQVTTLPPRSCGIGSTLVSTYALSLPAMIQLCVATIMALVLSFEVYNVSPHDANVGCLICIKRCIKKEQIMILYSFVIITGQLYCCMPP